MRVLGESVSHERRRWGTLGFLNEETTASVDEFPGLRRYGWTTDRTTWWHSHAAPIAVAGGVAPELVRPARVTRVDRGECDVIGEDGPERVASASHQGQSETAPATGDWIVVLDDPEAGPVVAAVMPRRTAMARRDPGPETAQQVLAANVDISAVVHSLDQPFSAGRLERFLVLAHDSGADPLVVLTKADVADAAPVVDQVVQLTDAPVVVTAAPTGLGLDELRRRIDGFTIVFIGLSGSGKSTLSNALLGDDVQTVTPVREGDSRGRHTTTRRELFLVPGGGVLIDTPGVRSIGLWDAWAAVHAVFADVADLAAGCRFSDCTHGREPGCAVRAAVDEGRLDAGRADRYRDLLVELTELDDLVVESERRQRRGGRPPR